ncbi:hypothetical protein JZ751_004010 [Albula glossodonta]|uniref:PLAT domain-containing protein n=1 Tax=Albula glossodonta TaxID=121402 RepID=A0A8T2P9U2_9TELE|nr:hypothetical protein JZ751_004010 [Albula glossodonta]
MKAKRVEPLLSSSDGWTVSVLMGHVGTQTRAFLWVCGTDGTAGPVHLDLCKNNGNTQSLPEHEAEFQISLRDVGSICKIRIGHNGRSEEPEWDLKRVTMRKMEDGLTLKFDASGLLLSDNHEGEHAYELPLPADDGECVSPDK